MEKRTLLALSGGIDSAALLAYLFYLGDIVQCVGFTYGSKHNELENEAAYKIAHHYKVPFHIIDLSKTMERFKSDLLQTGGPIPEGHYTAKNMKSTVVPGRNMIFISILAGLADSLGMNQVAIGVHKGDHAIYPDCRDDFIASMNLSVMFATEDRVRLVAPFLYNDKINIVQKGIELGVPFELTRTCYTDQKLACGKCGSCVERLEAFSHISPPMCDPVEYIINNEDCP